MALRKAEVHIISVGFGGNAELLAPELRAMASYPAEANTFLVEEIENMDDIFDGLVNSICDSKFY